MKTILIVVTSVILSIYLLHAESNDMKENDSSVMENEKVMMKKNYCVVNIQKESQKWSNAKV